MTELLFNPDLSVSARGSRSPVMTRPGGVEVLPGWVLVRAVPDAAEESVTAQRGFVRLVGRTTTRLLQVLPTKALAVRLTARVRITGGSLLAGPVLDDEVASNIRIEPQRDDARDEPWQDVDLGTHQAVNQVVFYCAAPGTVVDIAHVSLTPSSETSTAAPAARNGTAVAPLAALRPAALPVDPGGGGGGGGTNKVPYVEVTGVVCLGGNGSEPGARFPVSVSIEPYLVTRISVGVTCNGIGYAAALQPDGTYQAMVRAYVQGSIAITAEASGVCTVGSGSPYNGRLVSGATRDPVYLPVTFTNPLPTLAVSVPPSIALKDGQATPVPITATTADTNTFGPRTVTVVMAGTQTVLTPVNATTFTGFVPMDPGAIGSRSITVFATCTQFPSATPGQQVAAVTGLDVTPPALSVLYPHPELPTVLTDLALPVHVIGTASDDQSGVSSVAWSLTAEDPAPTPAVTTTGLASWSADVIVPAYAPTPLYLWASDAAGNTSTLSVTMNVRQARQAGDIEERLAQSWYLADLLTFAADSTTGELLTQADPQQPGQRPTIDQIADVLRQPVGRISLPQTDLAAEQADAPVNELRVPIEVLRAHLAAAGTPATENPDYLQAAYASILAGLGTSYTQLRLARAWSAEDRATLAAQLGLALSGPAGAEARPDQLDTLVLDVGSDLTEATLESLFGLASTQRADPLQPVAAGQLLDWRLAGARMRWQAQDLHPPTRVTYVAVLDPDLVSEAEISSPAMVLTLQGRAADLTSRATALDLARKAAATPAAALSAMLTVGLPPGTSVADLATAQQVGTDIAPALAAAGLDRAGFAYLVQLQSLVGIAGTTITEAEWADAIDVLTASLRRRSVADWQAQDTEAAYVFGPETFTAGDPPQPGRYRAQPVARADWERVLRTRTAERQSILDGAVGLVANAEQAAFPILRNALLAQTGEDGDTLTRRYELDLLSGGTLTNTRTAVAVSSVQLLYADVRAGSVADGSPAAGWAAAAGFDAAWNKTMNSYGSWRAGMSAYFFPEAALDPLAYPNATSGYQALVSALQNGAVADGPSFDAAMTAWQGVVLSWLQGLPLFPPPTSFAYRTGGPSDPAQVTNAQQLAAYCRSILSANPALPAADVETAREVFFVAPLLIAGLLDDQDQHAAALDWYHLVYAYTDPATQHSLYAPVDTEAAEAPVTPQLGAEIWAEATDLNPFSLTAAPGTRTAPHLRAALLAIIDCLRRFADAQFTAGTDGSLAMARQLYLQAQHLAAHRALQPVQPDPTYEPLLVIPRLTMLSQAIGVQLGKLRSGLNIAGSSVVVVTADAQTLHQPTPYPYKVLLARTQQLVTQAGQIEAQYQSALVNLDTQNAALLAGQHALGIADAQVAVHVDQVSAAQAGVTLAQNQLEKANATVTALSDAIASPPNIYEQKLFQNFSTIRDLQNGLAGVDAAIGIGSVAANLDLGKIFASGGLAAAGAATEIGGYAAKAALQLVLNNAQAGMQANQLAASEANRRQEWSIQLASAQQDIAIADDQVSIASDQVAVANGELGVARLQASAAADTLNQLTTQNLSAAMYSWLVSTLGGVYRFFLQQATATARLAQTQLAFERAQPVASFIRSDYTRPPAALVSAATPSDTLGLTGAELLAQDLATLDGYAFSTDQRKLNVSQSFSFASFFPVEFLGFRESGELSVAIGRKYFDLDFPGDYLRLVRQVRLSVVALVPPTRGIRARLSNSGLSRVTTPTAAGYTDVVLRRNPQSVEVTSPVSATGVFELDIQPQMLLPFEGSGVDTTWQVSLPKAANPFDYGSISDVVLTIDYTALADEDYRAIVIHDLNADRSRGGDCVVSLARDFPDQWYELTNPDDPTVDRSTTLSLPVTAFPASLSEVATTAIALQLHPTTGADLDPGTVTLTHGGATATAGTDSSGLAGSRRGADLSALMGQPDGAWMITLDPALGDQLDLGTVDDLVLDLTWSANAPAWPL